MAASTLANTGVVNCAAFPTKVSTGTSNANIAGIVGYANTITINNCYCPTPGSAFFYNGAASGSSRGTIYGWLRGNNGATGSSGEIINAYWIDGFKAGASSGSFTYTKKEQSLTDAQMKNNGAVSMPSTGTAYPCFLDALNAGADEYNKAMFFDVRAEEWVMGTNGYPVIACPGGSYSSHASHEGAVWAPYFNELGVAFAVLKYTLPAGDPSKPVGDMEIALSILNEMADKWLIDNVNRNTPQAFITYAKSETVVPPVSNGKAFYNAMIKAGAKAELLELNGTKHGWHHGNADHETAYLQPMKAKLTPWLQKL